MEERWSMVRSREETQPLHLRRMQPEPRGLDLREASQRVPTPGDEGPMGEGSGLVEGEPGRDG